MIDHDRLFKGLLSANIWEFIDLFIPEMKGFLDRDSLQLVDKELFADIPGFPRQEADLVFKGKFKGQDSFFLIHFEHQSTAPPTLPRRVFSYFFGLTGKYDLPVYPVVIYSHQCPKENSNEFRVKFPNIEVLVFRFHQIVLPRLSWKNYLKRPNPVSSALMALMGVKEKDRVRVKLECFRMLVQLKVDTKKLRFISGFIDNYLSLNAEEILIFNEESAKLSPVERGKIMELTTSWKEEGRQEGRQEGVRKGQIMLIERQLRRRCGVVSRKVRSKLNELSSSHLEELADALLDFSSHEDLEAWLYRHP